jgi:hypothetical protein
MMRASGDLGVSTASAVARKGGCHMSTSVPMHWSRALSTLLAGLLAAAAVAAAGYAATALLSQTTDSSGAICGSAWRFHSGSGTQVPAAELTAQQRARTSFECARSGDADWQRGLRFARLAAGAAAAAIAFALWGRFGPVGRPRPPGPPPGRAVPPQPHARH